MDEDEDDDIVVVKEEKIPITIDETEDGDQDGEVIFVAQTSAPSPSTWGRADADSSRLRLISEKETTAAAAALAPAHCSTNLSAIASVSTAISPSPCSADLSSIEDVGDDLGEGHESKPTLQRNLSLASAVDFSLSLEDADQSPLDLSKNSSADGKPGAGVDLSVLGSHHRASRYVNDVDSVGGVQMLASPFAIPSSSQAVISAGCPQVRQLGVADSSNTSAVLVNQDLKVGVQDQRRTSGALEVADVLMDFSAASTSSQMVGSTNLPSMSSVGSAGPVKLSPASSTSTDSSTQLLVDFLMQDDQLSQVLVPATTCSGSSLSSSHAQASGTVQSVVPSQSSVPCPQPPYLGQSSTSGNSAVIQTKSHFMHATKPEDLSPGGVSTQGLCVPGVRVLVGSPTLGFQQQPSTSGGANVAPTLDFAQIIAQVLDQQTDASSSGSSGAASSMMSSSSSLSSASTSSAALSSLSSSLPSTLSSSVGSVRTLYSSSNASFDNVNPAPTTAKTSGPALVSAKRNSTNSLSTLDNSSLPPRKRVRSLIIDSSSSVASSVGGKSMSFSGTSTAADAGTSSSDQGSNAVGSTTAASSSSVLPRPEDGGACERCQNSIIGTQLSRCTQGHRACGLCLEEQVKLVLTGRQKGSLKCISSNCSSYYPMSELKHSLPNMVVEILEDKLDRDYVEYISDMMLSNATSNSATNSTTTSSAATTTTAAAATISATPPPSTSKSSAEVQTSDNSDIDDNTDDNDADDSEDDSDNSTTSSSEMSTSTASTATIKRTIPTTKGKKLLPKSSSFSLSSLTSDDAIVPTTTSTTDLDNDDDNLSGDDEVYDDMADDYDEVMQRGGMGRGEGKCSGRWSRDRDDRQKDFPDNWVKMDNTTTLLAVPLKPDSEEYIEVAIRFHTTMTFPQADVTQILRIQNPIMWKYYSLKRLEMVQENDGLSVEEKMLFHGTKCSVIDAICRKGFDWRVCGKHGTAYGHGCYFARDSIYSHNYTDRTTEASQASVVLRSVSASSSSQPEREGGSSSSNHLTPASVNLSSLNPQPSQAGSPANCIHPIGHGWACLAILAGRQQSYARDADGISETTATVVIIIHTAGIRSEPFGKCYDSCVDNIFDPKIFVIFDSNQAYPEYIVEYKFVE
nr:hypothetical protein BaRGS_002149 [Batillaria attramentaria]